MAAIFMINNFTLQKYSREVLQRFFLHLTAIQIHYCKGNYQRRCKIAVRMIVALDHGGGLALKRLCSLCRETNK